MAFCPRDKSFTCFSISFKTTKKPKVPTVFFDVISIVETTLYKRCSINMRYCGVWCFGFFWLELMLGFRLLVV